MSYHYVKPEVALRKAEDLIKVGKKKQAMVSLHELLIKHRYQRVWSTAHEDVAKAYMRLAVELRENTKDALVQYRYICQQKPASLGEVLQYLYKLAKARMEQAEEEAASAGGEENDPEVDDETPEFMQLAAVHGDNLQERVEQQVLQPWLKYMWETTRTILDILRNNGRLEDLYHSMIRRGYSFCAKYEKKMYFRRLTELVRNHVSAITRYTSQQNRVELDAPETQQRYLITRFMQLDKASELELWQDAYRTIEDIHESLEQAGTDLEPQQLVTYYARLAQIFQASGNFLFHAYSLERVFELTVEAGESTPEELEALASRLLLATVCVPPTARFEDADSYFDAADEGNMRLAAMLGFRREVPTRSRLLAGLLKKGIAARASKLCRLTYSVLEHTFGPLTMKKRLAPALEAFAAEDHALFSYLEPLKKLVVVRLLQQLGRVFQTMRMDTFLALAPEMHVFAIERIVVNAVKGDQLSVRIDHRNRTISFSDERMEADHVRRQLVSLASRLGKVAEKIAPVDENKDALREQIFGAVQAGLDREHEEVFERRDLIQRRQVDTEKSAVEKRRRDAAERQAEQERRQKEERDRLEEDARKRELERKKRQAEEAELKQKKLIKDEIQKRLQEQLSGDVADRAAKKFEEIAEKLAEVDKKDLVEAQSNIMKEAKKEKERQAAETARRNDFMVRALRAEERPGLAERLEKQRVEDRERYADQYRQFVEKQRRAHENALAERVRLAKMASQRAEFQSRIMARRREVYAKAKAEQDARIAEKRAERDAELARQRAEEERLEEERRRREEEEQRRNEAARKAEEERRQIQAERQRKLDEQSERQRQRERELEERQQSDSGRFGGTGMRGGAFGPRRTGGYGDDRGAGGSYAAPRGGDRPSYGGDRPSYGGDRPSYGGDRPSYASRGGDDRQGGGGGAWRPSRDRDAAPRRDPRDAAPRRDPRDSRDSRDSRDAPPSRDSQQSSGGGGGGAWRRSGQ